VSNAVAFGYMHLACYETEHFGYNPVRYGSSIAEEGGVGRMSERGSDLIVLAPSAGVPVPPIIASAGRRASRRFVEFFTANIRNLNTREAYARAINAFCPGVRMKPARRST
jgi:hypothetical protein